ncbi:hypothetical protein HYPSUDRAFT_970402 [Hypholoma sublateritium FD-334 SS-4]|uniref:Uncharacterized protein n=1 Tax=Hypholoma sublateritium (strain FD-334 SS-4) TaxID=945553 RepID=A0A0D2M4E0_HYPSF|nr:hypothetical protein HYPSUDRAFT_970402 [Hypholoma sublateritium FD-334 SS-4]
MCMPYALDDAMRIYAHAIVGTKLRDLCADKDIRAECALFARGGNSVQGASTWTCNQANIGRPCGAGYAWCELWGRGRGCRRVWSIARKMQWEGYRWTDGAGCWGHRGRRCSGDRWRRGDLGDVMKMGQSQDPQRGRDMGDVRGCDSFLMGMCEIRNFPSKRAKKRATISLPSSLHLQSSPPSWTSAPPHVHPQLTMFTNRPQTPALSSAHSYTLMPDDDDDDICPVCDGECTCTKAPPPPQRVTPGGPLSMAELSLRYAASTPTSPSSGPPCSSPSPPTPAPLKIKLTVPLGMRRPPPPPPSTATPTPASTPKPAYIHQKQTAYTYTNKIAAPRPRPQSAPLAAPFALAAKKSRAYKPLNPKSAAPGKHPRSAAAASKVRKNLKARAKKAAGRRRAVSSDDDDDESSALSDADVSMAPPLRRGVYAQVAGVADPDDDFPTFVSASALSSLSSDSSSALSAFDSDSSVEAEEESFIRNDVSRRRSGGDWVIRPRKKSVGLSDAEMDVDSDATDDEVGDADADADETEEDGTMRTLPPVATADECDSTDERRRYTGHATGWSDDDDESSFDADLFFANLSDDDSSTTASEAEAVSASRRPAKRPPPTTTIGATTEGAAPPLPFEVAEGWDGQLVFTNGTADAAHIVDVEFEADARGFGDDGACEHALHADTHAHRRPGSAAAWREEDAMYDAEEEDDHDVDVDEMDTDSDALGEDVDDGYAEGSGGDGSGDTTDEELVGADALPNARAMRLFSLPLSVSAIDPLSTVSSPAVSPARLRRGSSPGVFTATPHGGRGKGYLPGWDRAAERRERERERRRRMWGGESVRAADILEGRVLFWDSDEQAHDCDALALRRRANHSSGTEESDREGSRRRRRSRRSAPCGPRQGVFVLSGETRQAVIGDGKTGGAVPSPHPRFKGRGRGTKKRFSAVSFFFWILGFFFYIFFVFLGCLGRRRRRWWFFCILAFYCAAGPQYMRYRYRRGVRCFAGHACFATVL